MWRILNAGRAMAAQKQGEATRTTKTTNNSRAALLKRRYALTKLMKSYNMPENEFIKAGHSRGAGHAR